MSHILVIDDDPMMMIFLEEYLHQYYSISTSPNGARALESMESSKIPNLIILDLMMPVMDGFSFIENVRSRAEFDRLPILVLSGSEKSEDRVRCLTLGADDFVIKPFNPEELVARIRNLIRRLN